MLNGVRRAEEETDNNVVGDNIIFRISRDLQQIVFGIVPAADVTSPLLLPQYLVNPMTVVVIALNAPGMMAQSPPMVAVPADPYRQHLVC